MIPQVVVVDPGVDGGFAIIRPSTPVCIRRFITFADAKHRLDEILKDERTLFVIEQVHASPVMSPSSAFTFGGNFEGWKVLALCLGCQPYGITPSQWQRAFAEEIGMAKNLFEGRTGKSLHKAAIKKVAEARAVTRGMSLRDITLATCDAYLMALYVQDCLARNGDEFIEGKLL